MPKLARLLNILTFQEGYIMLTPFKKWTTVSVEKILEGGHAQGKGSLVDDKEAGLVSPSISEVDAYAYTHCYGD